MNNVAKYWSLNDIIKYQIKNKALIFYLKKIFSDIHLDFLSFLAIGDKIKKNVFNWNFTLRFSNKQFNLRVNYIQRCIF
jgi:hypothetical protein